jgi:predicted TPR repeat methyltransferase
MDTKQAYDLWSAQYDTNHNRTRDLEGQALRITLASLSFDHCLEIGCGTGKNTEWLMGKAQKVMAVDLSVEMLAKAKEKIASDRVQFQQADITTAWTFGKEQYDLVSFSLVLEHIENLDPIFQEVSQALVAGGYVYVGELHPFKQYAGSKARFDTENGRQIVACFNHHVSDFIGAAKQHGLVLVDLNEHFDNNDRNSIPRILTIVLKKP